MDQAVRFVESVTEHYRPAVWVLIYTGIRPAELCGLLVRDVDSIRRHVHIDRTWSPIPGFDGNARQHLEGPTKTDAGDRTIPLPPGSATTWRPCAPAGRSTPPRVTTCSSTRRGVRSTKTLSERRSSGRLFGRPGCPNPFAHMTSATRTPPS
jgi:hypothetical protein